MRKKVYLLTFLVLTMFLGACDNDEVNPLKDKGTIFVDSNPEKAAIYIDGKSTGKFTPGVVEVIAGVHHGSVKKDGFADAKFTAEVTVGNEFTVPPLDLFKYGVLQIKSEPEQAQIWIDGDNSKSTTPNSFSLADGRYSITLKYDEYKDSTFAVNIVNAQDTIVSVNLQPTFVSKYSGILWDTTNAADNQPSGIQLSTGRLLTIKPGTGQSKLVDVFFTPDGFGGFIIRTASGVNGMTRLTRFKVSKSKNINDGVNSPTEDATWRDNYLASDKNYVFLYDSDGHYSKLQIIRRFENPARVEIKWIYNDRPFDPAF
jgi:hypothetical protein